MMQRLPEAVLLLYSSCCSSGLYSILVHVQELLLLHCVSRAIKLGKEMGS